jgi:major membrane immunogen (membrane-anchored lipoprotein)
MRSFRVTSICVALAGLLILGACSKSEQAGDNTDAKSTQPETAATTPATDKTAAAPSAEHGKPKPGGMTVETSGIHLEMVPEKEAAATHLDLYVQKGDNHEPIPTAKVVAQVQSPDGKQQSLDMKYDAQGKHYAAVVPGKAAGQYQVKITADISGKKVDGRFNFSR